jgi:hypothetical protein
VFAGIIGIDDLETLAKVRLVGLPPGVRVADIVNYDEDLSDPPGYVLDDLGIGTSEALLDVDDVR